MCRLFFADEYARRTAGTYTAAHLLDIESAFQAALNVLSKLENRVIEFLSEWLVTLSIPGEAMSKKAGHLTSHSC